MDPPTVEISGCVIDEINGDYVLVKDPQLLRAVEIPRFVTRKKQNGETRKKIDYSATNFNFSPSLSLDSIGEIADMKFDERKVFEFDENNCYQSTNYHPLFMYRNINQEKKEKYGILLAPVYNEKTKCNKITWIIAKVTKTVPIIYYCANYNQHRHFIPTICPVPPLKSGSWKVVDSGISPCPNLFYHRFGKPKPKPSTTTTTTATTNDNNNNENNDNTNGNNNSNNEQNDTQTQNNENTNVNNNTNEGNGASQTENENSNNSNDNNNNNENNNSNDKSGSQSNGEDEKVETRIRASEIEAELRTKLNSNGKFDDGDAKIQVVEEIWQGLHLRVTNVLS